MLITKTMTSEEKIKHYVSKMEDGEYIDLSTIRKVTLTDSNTARSVLDRLSENGVLKVSYKQFCIDCQQQGDFSYDSIEEARDECDFCEASYGEDKNTIIQYKKILPEQKRIELNHGSARVDENVTKETIDTINKIVDRVHDKYNEHKFLDDPNSIIRPSRVRVGEFYDINGNSVQIMGMLYQYNTRAWRCFYVHPDQGIVFEYDYIIETNKLGNQEARHRLLCDYHNSDSELDFNMYLIERIEKMENNGSN